MEVAWTTPRTRLIIPNTQWCPWCHPCSAPIESRNHLGETDYVLHSQQALGWHARAAGRWIKNCNACRLPPRKMPTKQHPALTACFPCPKPQALFGKHSCSAPRFSSPQKTNQAGIALLRPGGCHGKKREACFRKLILRGNLRVTSSKTGIRGHRPAKEAACPGFGFFSKKGPH